MKISVAEAASLLGSTRERVLSWIEDGGLPAQHLRGEYHLNRTEILEWATEHGVAIAPRAFARVPGENRDPSVGEALRSGGIHYGVPAPDVGTALRKIVGRLPLEDPADRETLLQIILARRALGMTPVGDGIAIPHVRTPIILSPAGAVLSLAFLEHPLDLGAADRRAIDTFFFLVSPTVQGHLAMLSRLAYCLRAAVFRDAVMRRLPAAEILQACVAAEGGA
jgi:PTS system nitrogen regulatory IIA component